jgi:protein TonB
MSKSALSVGVALLATCILSMPARAEWRCDCTRVTGSCNASVDAMDSYVEVTSDEKACARVEYLVDGQPFVALVVDGKYRQEWMSRSQEPQVVVQSCQLCEDRLTAQARTSSAPAPAAPPTGGTDAPPAASADTPLIKVTPVYPARAGGQPGEVVVEVKVTASGAVGDARIVESEPRGLFDQAALDAVRRWRYPEGSARVVRERITFAAPQATAATPPGGPRNGCVKEGTVDELIDIVQAQLINACVEPVLVRSCAEGFAERAGQWVCNEPIGLVARGDRRTGLVGELRTSRGRINFGYAQEDYLERPVGSRYAYIACADGDAECYDAAVRWAEYLDGKPSDVDPRAGSEVDVAVVR